MNTYKPFLEACIEDIIAKHGSDFSQSICILPNKRPIIFIKKYIAELSSQACFLPKFYTIQDFFTSFSSRTIPHRLQLIHIVYILYCKHTGSTETFEEFYSWGDMLLNDFNEIDTYCIPYKDMFANLSAIKEFSNTFDYLNEDQIEIISRFWDTAGKNSNSTIQSKFISIWQTLEKIYTELNEILDKNQYAYEGKMHRDIVNNLPSLANFNDSTKLFFIGFNALNTCEIQLFNFFKTNKKGYFYWDYDTYYANQNHEAGYFITKNIDIFGNELPQDYFNSFSHKKQITIVEAPNPIAQVKQCKSFIDSNNSDTGAIILADEQLLIPLINSLPPSHPYNISLGFPIPQTQAWSTFETLLLLHKSCKNGSFNTKHLRSFFSQSTIQQCFETTSKACLERLYTYNFSYISLASLPIDDTCKQVFFEYTEQEYTKFLTSCISYITTHGKLHTIDLSIWYAIYSEIEVLQSILQKLALSQSSISFIHSILSQSIVSKSVPIAGEPLQGIQIMGILETRLLDFESLTIISLNENILPKKSPGSSFIPYSLRVAFGMPTIKEHNSIFAYYFYRIIQRAQTIRLVYSAQSDDQGAGEKSRYITQLLYQYPQYNPQATITTEHIAYPIAPHTNKELLCTKETKECKDFLERIQSGTQTISPTSFYTYIQCPLRFYFSEIIKIKKSEDIKELPDDRDYGNFFHNSMEALYTPYTNTIITEKTIDTIASNANYIEQIVLNGIQKELEKQHIELDSSKIQMQKHVISKYITNMLEFDRTQTPFTITGLEERILFPFSFASKNITIKCIIDRIHTINNTIAIIDYKTGSNKLECKSIEELFDGTKENANAAVFQICVYAYIISLLHPHTSIVPQLFFIRDLHKTSNTHIYLKNTKQSIHSFDEIKDTFIPLFEQKIQDLLSPDIPFSQTHDEKHCEHCDYKVFCKK